MDAPDSTCALGPEPENRKRYPWYDSGWFSKYQAAKETLRRVRPQALPAFLEAVRPLHTRPDFRTTLLEHPFDAGTLADIRRVVASLKPTDLELHEARRFGRFVVHDHPFFTELQERTVQLVSEIAGEPLEAAYNFLSLYSRKGVCTVHLDSPESKWTLDLCVDQSTTWPIHISDVQAWPDTVADEWTGANWETAIRNSKSRRFTPYVLQPGEAAIFSGSSQWHYRDPIPGDTPKRFCTLLFLHFIPRGAADIVKPKNWARLFDVPELER